jgi:fido (protein-threonine AMPylation protein)
LAQFLKLRHNQRQPLETAPHFIMTTLAALLQTIQSHPTGLTLTELLALHPALARRSVQRWISQWIAAGQITAQGEGRARRYLPVVASSTAMPGMPGDAFPTHMPLSADSQDILTYVTQPLQARRPVGYQRDFLDTYQPNVSAYLSAPLRRQLHNMGKTSRMSEPAGTYSRAILNRLLIDLSWASSHLEGNTYSRLDTVELIEHGRTATGKGAVETQMILNHKSAIELLVDNAGINNTEAVGLSRYLLMNLHSALAENLLPNPADEGRIRQHAVDIGKSVYRPLSTPQQIDETLDRVLTKLNQISNPFEQSFFAMVHLPYLQPFADINKRTSRLVANLPLFRANLCPLTFLDVPEAAYSAATLGVYEMTRVELLRDLYMWAYERSTQEYQAIRQDLAEPDPLRLAYREMIKHTVREVVQQPQTDPLQVIERALKPIPFSERADLHALLVQELQRLHEGVLARYGLRPSELVAWVLGQKML